MDICTAYDLANAYYGLFKDRDYLELMYSILDQVLNNSNSFDVKTFIARTFASDHDKAVFHLNIEIAYSHARLWETSKALEILSQVSSMIKGDKVLKMYYNDVLAEVYIIRNQRDLAIEVLKAASALDADTQSCEHIGTHLLWNLERLKQLAKSYFVNGLVNQAKKTFRESLRIAHDIYGYESQHKDVAQIYLNLAYTTIKQKNLLKAKDYLEQTKMMMSRNNTQYEIVFLFHLHSSDLMIAQEDYKSALQYLYELIKIVGEWSDNGRHPFDSGKVYLRMGKCYLNLGKIAAAERNLLLSRNYFDKADDQDREATG